MRLVTLLSVVFFVGFVAGAQTVHLMWSASAERAQRLVERELDNLIQDIRAAKKN